jgi:hypothetical protein
MMKMSLTAMKSLRSPIRMILVWARNLSLSLSRSIWQMNTGVFSRFSKVVELMEGSRIFWNEKGYCRAGTILRINEKKRYSVSGAWMRR